MLLIKTYLNSFREFLTMTTQLKFNGHTTTEQRNENRAYGNYSAIVINMQKVNKTMREKVKMQEYF